MIIKMERKTFINELGNKEYYIYKELEKIMSHHINIGSGTYTCGDCDNCNGAHCDVCKPIFLVVKYKEPVFCEELGSFETKVSRYSVLNDEDEALWFYENMLS